MKKRTYKIIATVVLLSFGSSGFAQPDPLPAPAEYASSEMDTSQSEVTDASTPLADATQSDSYDTNADDLDEETPQGKPVGKASEDGAKQAKRRMWGNIALAAAAVVVAVVAIIVASNNNGHSHK